MDNRGRSARSRQPRAAFDPVPPGWRCRHLWRLPARCDGAGTLLVAHDGPAAGRAAAVFASVGYRACPDLRRSRRLGNGPHGDWPRSRHGTRDAAGTERVVPDTGWQGWATVKRMRIVPGWGPKSANSTIHLMLKPTSYECEFVGYDDAAGSSFLSNPARRSAMCPSLPTLLCSS